MLDSYIKGQKRIRIDDTKLVASEYIKSGSTILVQAPLASVPLPAKRHQRCNYCLRKAQLQCCSRCRSAYFCSNSCFRNAWLHFHRVLCEPQETDIYKDVDADRWLLERTALTLHSHDRLNKQVSHSPPHLPFAIEALQLHTPLAALDIEQHQHNTTVADVAMFLEPFDCQISTQDLDALWHRIKLSSFPILDPEYHLEQMAVGVYPITSLYITHSCRPNAALLYKQGMQSVVTLDEVLPGEPITISYVDLISTKAQRTKALQERFGPGFVCHCLRCEGELSSVDAALEKGESLEIGYEEGLTLLSGYIKSWSVLDMVRVAELREKDSWSPIQVMEPPQFSHFVGRLVAPELYYGTMDEKKSSQEKMYKIYLREDRAHLLQRIPQVMMALLDVPQTPAFTLSMIKAAEELLLKRIMEGRWVETSRCALYLFVVYRLLYPPLHPKMAYHTLILARSGWNALVEMELIGVEKKLERIYANGTRNWIDLARNAIEATFGRDSNLWRDVIELQWVYERERNIRSS